jgi:hypothetical protein
LPGIRGDGVTPGSRERFNLAGGLLTFGGCPQKRQLLEDYVERVQALAVESELLLAFDKDSEGNLAARWQRIEHARIACEIARLALIRHTDEHGC